MDNQADEENRRPLAVRNLSLTRKIAVYLSRKNISPNQISLMSIAFALLGFFGCIAFAIFDTVYWLGLFVLGVQFRLLCNLFDGMVAVEGGKKTPAGELFNDVPDRIADPIIIVAAGFITSSDYGFSIAWFAAVIAILTAYIRVLGVSMNCPADFRGPMAKQHRMALLTFTAVVFMLFSSFELFQKVTPYLFDASLLLISIGGTVTCWVRLKGIYQYKALELQTELTTEDTTNG